MPVHVRMAPRNPHEHHRVATPLELFFDLAFVVAVAQAAASLHHGLVEGHVGDALIGFPLTFFGIWWAWMNFSWFASAYDCDDVLYRLAVFTQMSGVLVLAAGVPRAFDERDFTVLVVGYVIMRLAMVAQWLRAAASDESRRRCNLRYAVGIALVQVGWVLWLLVPEGAVLVGFVGLVVAELAVPAWAERASHTPWHPHHIVERYGLFTIIVLGESVLGATIAVQQALDADGALGDVITVIIGGLLVVFSMWWIYFSLPSERLVERARNADDRLSEAFIWGYGHYFVFAAVAATGAGIAIAVDGATDHSTLSDVGTGLAVTLPIGLYVLTVWVLYRAIKPRGSLLSYAPPLAALVILAASLTPAPVLISGLVLVGLVALGAVTGDKRPASEDQAVQQRIT